jgi:hypothetical protein
MPAPAGSTRKLRSTTPEIGRVVPGYSVGRDETIVLEIDCAQKTITVTQAVGFCIVVEPIGANPRAGWAIHGLRARVRVAFTHQERRERMQAEPLCSATKRKLSPKGPRVHSPGNARSSVSSTTSATSDAGKITNRKDAPSSR